MKDNNKKDIKEKEDASKYGEFVSSYFTWQTLDGQKKRAKELEEMTKKINETIDKNKKGSIIDL